MLPHPFDFCRRTWQLVVTCTVQVTLSQDSANGMCTRQPARSASAVPGGCGLMPDLAAAIDESPS